VHHVTLSLLLFAAVLLATPWPFPVCSKHRRVVLGDRKTLAKNLKLLKDSSLELSSLLSIELHLSLDIELSISDGAKLP
jgi:hypothetical protein